MPDQSPHDQLAAIVSKNLDFIGGDPYVIAEDVIESGWRPPAQRIDTTEELTALPVGSVFVDQWDTAWYRGALSWTALHARPEAPNRVVMPATVVYLPMNGGNRA